MGSKMNDVKTYLTLITISQLETWSVQSLLDKKVAYNKKFILVPIGDFLKKSRNVVDIEDNTIYRRIRIKIRNGGVEERDTKTIKGIDIGTKKQFIAKGGQFILSKIDARNGAFGLISDGLDGAVVTNDFPLFDVDKSKILPEFLVLITTTNAFIDFAQSCSSGTTNRQRMDVDLFLKQKIPLPSLADQERIVNAYNEKIDRAKELETKAEELEIGIEEYLFEKLGIEKNRKSTKIKGLQFYSFNDITEWGFDKIKSIGKSNRSEFKNFPVVKLAIEVFRGKSPVYKNESPVFILNQKCNRWNLLDVSFAKNVDDKWFSSIDESFFTKEGDILINSTGEGTIGRATYIKNEYQGLLYDSHMLLLRIDSNIMNPELFVELFNSSFGQSQVNDLKSAQATKQTELGVGNLNRIIMPVPESLQFQEEIVEKIKGDRGLIINLKSEANINIMLALEEFEKEIFGYN
ncbi:restriction endonuclease subunit S [Paludibacter sp.]|uniref:restriction endonuclease subunit S n=1 Tax=Paludibacter sp. TaxID=1898105 RepID=UPI0025E9CEED|nr:restriction endonuclease subunit S [Paludibacter sp.]